jgi:HD-like signal output (HDOD) protein
MGRPDVVEKIHDPVLSFPVRLGSDYWKKMSGSEVKKFIENIDGLSTLPVLIGKILSIVQKQDCSLDDLNSLIAHDQAMAEQVIRSANSAFFGHSGQIRDIKQAIMFLGFGRIKSIAVGMNVMTIFPHTTAFNIKFLWIHCYEVALIASVISDFISMASPPECFLSGLLHDVGRIIFYKMNHEDFFKIPATDDMLEKETELFGCTHAEVGAWFAEAAAMPSEIILTTRYHHGPSLAQEFRDSISIVSLAEAMSRMYSPRIEDDGLWTAEHDALLLELGIDSKQLAVIGEKLYGARIEAEKFFHS